MTMTTRRARRIVATAGVALIATLGVAGTAAADDHLFTAAHSSGVDSRGFANPVANNPSNNPEGSGSKAQPGTVPGLGNPNAGADQGTPSFDCESLIERLTARSEGHGPSCD